MLVHEAINPMKIFLSSLVCRHAGALIQACYLATMY
jgi:hypothetical protein